MSEALCSASFPALGTTAVVVVRGAEALALARARLERELDAVDRSCSRFRSDSELVQLNDAAGSSVRVGPYLLEALERALEAAAGTDGAVDPTVGRALRVTGYDRTFALVRRRDGPTVKPGFAVGGSWRSIEIDRARRLVRIPNGVEVDLGATAKAMAADRAARAAAAATGVGVMISLGGDVAVAGEPPEEGWSIGLADDHAEELGPDTPAVAIRSGGLASSGTSVRRWSTAAGDRHHIVDPRTGTSVDTPWRTVSVAAASCFDANTASTASLVLGEQAPAWLELRRLPARLVRNDGSVMVVAGWPAEAS